MATYVKYQCFVGDLAGGVHDLLGTNAGTDCDVLKLALSNTAPNVSTHLDLADVTEIAAGNGYTAGGTALPSQSGTRTAGTFTLTADAITFTASGSAMADFQYCILHNDDAADVLIAHWDHGSTVSLAVGESFTWRPNSEATGGTVLTLT